MVTENELGRDKAKRLALGKPHIYKGRHLKLWLVAEEGIIEENMIDKDWYKLQQAYGFAHQLNHR